MDRASGSPIKLLVEEPFGLLYPAPVAELNQNVFWLSLRTLIIMASTPDNRTARSSFPQSLVFASAVLVLVLACLFFEAFSPEKVHFSNDGPLGLVSSQSKYALSNFGGTWHSLNWLGTQWVASAPDLSNTFHLILGAVNHAKFFPALCLLTLGLCAWMFFRQLRFSPGVCVVGALAVALNSDYFSVACWGVAEQALCLGMNFLALAALADTSGRRLGIRLMLAGFAVGMGIMEGFDIGAIFSLVVAAYGLFQAVNGQPGAPAGRVVKGCLRVGVVAVCAGLIAAQSLSSLVGTQIQGVVGTSESEKETKERWDFATQWSLPKIETLQILVPGLFGYRMDTPDGGHYWGTIGGAPQVIEMMSSKDPDARAEAVKLGSNPGNSTYFRFTGGASYAGVLVILVAAWAAAQSGLKKGSVFSDAQRRAIWFWAALGFVGLLMAWGKYAPFYRLFYSLPFASTIRNPAKFIHVANWALTIIFAYGLHGLYLRYLQPALPGADGLRERYRQWRVKSTGFERNWQLGLYFFLGLAVLGWLMYAGSGRELQAYMQTVAIGASEAPTVAAFSQRCVLWFVVFSALGVGMLTAVHSGWFSGKRANTAMALLGLLVVADLARANLPWVVFWDYPYKYATNPIIDFLRDKPWEQRVASLPFGGPDEQSKLFGSVYGIEWNQHLFPYYDIQTLDLIQEPRETLDNNAFRNAIPVPGRGHPKGDPKNLPRLWELTNTRYLLGAAGFVEGLNQELDPQHRFRIRQRFHLEPKIASPAVMSDFKAVPDTNGPVAIIEFTGALPRAKLYANWKVETEATNTLAQLNSPAFKPAETVLVDRVLPAAPGAATAESPGTVTIHTNYTPKRIELTADVKAPAVLLYNEKSDPRWGVTVDGKPETLLHCNFIMRGVFLTPGKHEVVFQFAPQYRGLLISLGALVLALGLVGFLLVSPGEDAEEKPEAKPEGEPARSREAAKGEKGAGKG